MVSKLYLTPVNGAFTSGKTNLTVQDNATVLHVLGANDGGTAEGITVHWLGGSIEKFERVRADTVLTLNEGMQLVYAEGVAEKQSFADVSAAFDSAVQK